MRITIFCSVLVAASLIANTPDAVTIARTSALGGETGGRAANDDVRSSRELGASTSTTFGVYRPYLTPAYKLMVGLDEPAIGNNFANVATARGAFPWNNYFTVAERQLLASNGFMARPEQVASFSSAYAAELSPGEMGSFVTVDAIIHGLRVTLTEATRDMERNYASTELGGHLGDLSEALAAQLAHTHSPQLDGPFMRALAYVQTAQILLDQSTQLDPRVAAMVTAEIANIKGAAGSLPSAIFPQRTINYAIFAPVGYYAADARLGAYYRAKVWLSHVGFDLRAPGGGLNVAAVRDAAVLAHAIDAMPQSAGFKQTIANINGAEAFLDGADASVEAWELLSTAMTSYYGRIVVMGADYLGDERMINGFAKYVAERAQDLAPASTGVTFRLIEWGDGAGSLVERTAREMHAGRGNIGYALMASAGSSRAADLLGARSGLATGDAPDPLGVSMSERVGDIQHALLYTMQPLMGAERPEGYPHFMRSDAWRDRELLSALGAVADYAHAPATLQMQSVAKAGRVAASRDLGTEGYVEPNPEAWARVASLAAYLRDGFVERRGERMVGRRVEAKLRDIESVSANMMQIASLELGGKNLTKEQLALIATMRDRIVAYESFADTSLQPDGYVITGGTAAIAGNDRIANGHPLIIYAVVPRNDGEQGLMLTRGAVYSFYETADDDDAWMEHLTTPSEAPALDSRVAASFVSHDRPFAFAAARLVGVTATVPATAVSYTPTKGEQIAASGRAELHLENTGVTRGNGELWFTVSAPNLEGEPLVAEITNTAGNVVKQVEVGQIKNGERLDVLQVGALAPGEYDLRVHDIIGNLLATARFRVLR